VSARGGFLAIAALSVAALLAAWVSQHRFGMEPCPWCVLQRLLFAAIALAALLGLAARRIGAALALALAAGGAAAALWQHFVASKSQSCDLTLADRIVSDTLQLDRLLPDMFAVRASCADAAVDLLGVPYELWSLALYLLIGLVSAALLFRREGN
jgi:disulfide bond formation protein DsbB